MKKNSSVKIRKLAPTDQPWLPTPAPEAYIAGVDNPGVSLPVAYEIEGELLRDVVIGESMSAFRRKRNGVEVPGLFVSTPVVSLEELTDRAVVKTANSVYEVILLSPESEAFPL